MQVSPPDQERMHRVLKTWRDQGIFAPHVAAITSQVPPPTTAVGAGAAYGHFARQAQPPAAPAQQAPPPGYGYQHAGTAAARGWRPQPSASDPHTRFSYAPGAPAADQGFQPPPPAKRQRLDVGAGGGGGYAYGGGAPPPAVGGYESALSHHHQQQQQQYAPPPQHAGYRHPPVGGGLLPQPTAQPPQRAPQSDGYYGGGAAGSMDGYGYSVGDGAAAYVGAGAYGGGYGHVTTGAALQPGRLGGGLLQPPPPSSLYGAPPVPPQQGYAGGYGGASLPPPQHGYQSGYGQAEPPAGPNYGGYAAAAAAPQYGVQHTHSQPVAYGDAGGAELGGYEPTYDGVPYGPESVYTGGYGGGYGAPTAQPPAHGGYVQDPHAAGGAAAQGWAQPQAVLPALGARRGAPGMAVSAPRTELSAVSLQQGGDLGAAAALYGGMPHRCGQCALRFATPALLSAHATVHAREALAARAKGIMSRMWFMPAEEWEAQMSGGAGREGGASGAATATAAPAKSFFDLAAERAAREAEEAASASDSEAEMTVPVRAHDPDTTCAVCGETFKRAWDDDADEWVFKGALVLGGELYHASCAAGRGPQ
jgi:hypothetical protein